MMEIAEFDLIADLATDPNNGWSIGSFGAIAEFVRDPDEPAWIRRESALFEVATARGAMRIAPGEPLSAVAWDSLSADGESWGHALAFCCERPDSLSRIIRSFGVDDRAIRPEDRGDRLFDLGVGAGAVTMALRTADATLISVLEQHEGAALLDVPSIMGEVLRAQPHRILISPAGRIEVYQPIPAMGGKSPIGPHTHLLAKHVPMDRTHSSNTPIPDGMQSALNVHPRSPWRTALGERHDFQPDIDVEFAPMLAKFGLAADHAVERTLRAAITRGEEPNTANWPDTRRGRAKARIVLRRMAAAGDDRAKPWRVLHDRGPLEVEEGEEA
jgi:hypothetical protein